MLKMMHIVIVLLHQGLHVRFCLLAC